MDVRLQGAILCGIVAVLLLVSASVGGRAERAAALASAVAWTLSLAAWVFGEDDPPIVRAMAADAVLLLVFARLSWKAARVWIAWATGVQAVALALHVASVQAAAPGADVFSAARTAAALAIAFLTAWGAFQARGSASRQPTGANAPASTRSPARARSIRATVLSRP